MALARIKRSPHLHGGKGLAIAGLLMGYLLPIGIMIAAGAFVIMRGKMDKVKDVQVKKDFSSLTNSLLTYKLCGGWYPTSQQGLRALVVKPTSSPIPRRWVQQKKEEDLLDPWGNPYTYRFPGKSDSSDYEIICLGPDGLANTVDDISSQDSLKDR